MGSTKENIHDTVSSLSMEECFIGGHPMAGSEQTVMKPPVDFFSENAYYVIAPHFPKQTGRYRTIKGTGIGYGSYPPYIKSETT